ncbi:unnamed protein product [Brassicogethes aeneus]|uniref:Uncharacterized protein n=1 Tax=Brassicogethes aeneus TaxID=1431903 RepID=A0A9P0FHS8_BRAAE|nr:unnamed protein product [Brassicogethes aeneus]
MDSDTDQEILTNIIHPENSTHLSITTVLNYCKKKILNPYLRLLSYMGLRPFAYDHQETTFCLSFFNFTYTTLVVLLMLCGYVLQYMACFRRDRGFCQKLPIHSGNPESQHLINLGKKEIYEKTCDGSLLFTFIIPGALHLFGYLNAVIIFRSSDDDQLPLLMERVFISSANLPNGFLNQKKLVRTLWYFVFISMVWMALSLISVNTMMGVANIEFKWIAKSPIYITYLMKGFLVFCTLWHDIIQASVISNYCLQAQLLTSYLQFLRLKLLQYPIQPLEWMRDIEDFKKMLKYFNTLIAPGVCLFTIINLTYSVSGLLWLFNFDHIDSETLPIFGLSILNVGLWILISMAPFVQAARLTNACSMIKAAGQEVRIRPFVHQDTPSCELDSVLIYTSSLKIDAQLFYMPIDGKYLCFFVTIASIVIIVLGQLHYLL